jgi:hypothetical protein
MSDHLLEGTLAHSGQFGQRRTPTNQGGAMELDCPIRATVRAKTAICRETDTERVSRELQRGKFRDEGMNANWSKSLSEDREIAQVVSSSRLREAEMAPRIYGGARLRRYGGKFNFLTTA